MQEMDTIDLNKIKFNEVLVHYYKDKETLTEDHKMAVNVFSQYCKNYYSSAALATINQDFFNKFLLYYLPKIKLNLNERQLKSLLIHVYRIIEEVTFKYDCDLATLYKNSYMRYADDTVRIIDLRKELLKNADTPIISWHPLVIDLNYYRLGGQTKKKSWLPKKEVYEQGYFELVERLGNYQYLFKKLHGLNSYIKIRLDKGAIHLLKNNDVLHMRIKRKLFSTNWEIIEIKGCYLSDVNPFISI